MKLKTTEVNGTIYAEVQDGKPVYVAEDGKSIPFDAPATSDTIKRLNGEAKAHREAKEAAEARLKAFDGLDDPDKARRALETVKNLDDKTLIDAGEVEKVKQQAKEAYDEQLKAQEKKYKPVVEERDSLRHRLEHEQLSTAFGRSRFIADKLAVPVDLTQAKFGSHFQVTDDGKIRAKGADGNLVYSRANPGNPAEFDEALEILVDAYPHRDSILKGSGASGGGAQGGGTGGGARQVTRAQFNALNPVEQAKVAREATIID